MQGPVIHLPIAYMALYCIFQKSTLEIVLASGVQQIQYCTSLVANETLTSDKVSFYFIFVHRPKCIPKIFLKVQQIMGKWQLQLFKLFIQQNPGPRAGLVEEEWITRHSKVNTGPTSALPRVLQRPNLILCFPCSVLWFFRPLPDLCWSFLGSIPL